MHNPVDFGPGRAGHLATRPPPCYSARKVKCPPPATCTQLGEWAKLGFITRAGFATYALNTPPADTPSTTTPDPLGTPAGK